MSAHHSQPRYEKSAVLLRVFSWRRVLVFTKDVSLRGGKRFLAPLRCPSIDHFSLVQAVDILGKQSTHSFLNRHTVFSKSKDLAQNNVPCPLASMCIQCKTRRAECWTLSIRKRSSFRVVTNGNTSCIEWRFISIEGRKIPSLSAPLRPQ